MRNMKPNFKDIDIKKVAASKVEGNNEANWISGHWRGRCGYGNG